jgi:hypothetical protein
MNLKQFHDMGEHVLDMVGGLKHVTMPSLSILHSMHEKSLNDIFFK